MMSSPSSTVDAQSPGLKTFFKTPEDHYKLLYEKTHLTGLLHYSHGMYVSQVTIAHLEEKRATESPSTSSTLSTSGGVRSVVARLLGGGNGCRALCFIGGNGVGNAASCNNRIGGSLGAFVGGSSGSSPSSNYDGKGTYLIFNAGDILFISDLHSQEKDPIKAIHFSNSIPACHAYDANAEDGHDLLIGMNTGEVYSVSLRQQLQDVGKKLGEAQLYNKDGAINNSRCTCVAWVHENDGTFIVSHADGNLYVYDKTKEGICESTFPAIKDQTQFGISHARSNKSNPVARWHICKGSINSITFSPDGAILATVGRDGYLRVFDYSKEKLICGGKNYYGALLCCAWSSDGKYILTGGEDDIVQVWSMEEQKVVAWGEGHSSWVSGVAFDSYWLAPTSDCTREIIIYRVGSAGQDGQLLLWDLVMDEIVVPLGYRLPAGCGGGSPTLSNGNQSAHCDSICPVGTLQPSPSIRDVPKLSPLVAHRAHVDPLSGLAFTNQTVLTVSREGHIKIWMRPGHVDSTRSNTTEAVLGFSSSVSKDEPPTPPVKAYSPVYKQPPAILLRN